MASTGRSTSSRTTGRPAPLLLMDRRFGPYLASKTVSQGGLWAHNLVAAIVTWQLTRSATMVGLVSLAQFGPQVLLAAWSGSLADRGDRVRQLVIGRATCSLASLVVGAWCLAGIDRAGTIGVLLCCSVVMGIGLAVGGPALLALVPSLVRPEEVGTALRLDAAPMLLGRTLGPAGGAVALAGLGPGMAFIIAAGSNVLFAFVVIALRRRVRSGSPSGGGDRSMRAALVMLRRDRRLLLLFVGIAATTVGSDPSLTLAPAVAHLNRLSATTAGAYTAAFGLGAALAVMLMGLLERAQPLERLVCAGLILMAVANVVVAVPIGFVGSAAAFGGAGFGMSLAMTGCTTLLQLAVSEEYRGRVMSLWMVAFIAPRPVSALLDGVLADLVSVETALVVVALLLAGAAWVCRPARLVSPAAAR